MLEYENILSFFDAALKTYGRIDAAISCAGLIEMGGGWFEPSSTIEAVRQRPSPKVVEVNLIGFHVLHKCGHPIPEGRQTA